MSDLYIDGEMLDRVPYNLGHIDELFGKPIQAMEEIDAKAMGASRLLDLAEALSKAAKKK
ncbi:hypothetical protein [Streptomyces parvulus]|uniref:hypothetical protein n=1 Tax=Streptomyces parvulus TaxID=146923 RepID=UPI001CFB1DD9|nr:hypothetical protein [Streptomyces parvulus]